MNRLHLLLAPLAAILIGAAPPAAEQAAADRIRAHVEFLADDLLEGRDTGQRGHAIAAAYVASEFRKLGLAPGGTDGSWYSQVPFRRATHAAPPTIRFARDGKVMQLASGIDVGVRPSVNQKQRRIDAPLVFAGHGISDAKLGIDEYAGLDVRGKIVVVLSGGPRGLPTEIAAHIDSFKDETAAAKGAVGIIEVSGTSGRRRSDRLSYYANQPIVDWVDKLGRAGGSAAIAANISLSSEWAERLFDGASKSLSSLRRDSDKPLRGFDLAGRLTIDATSAWQDFTSPEVIGILPGSDPALAKEYVVLMGHLDHLGVKPDAKPGEDAIYNGALDNAAGVATMIEAAQSFVNSGKPPRRSVMFIANTGEERGLLGADYYATHPTVPLSGIVGVVDLDMPLLLYDFTDVTAFGADHSTVARSVADAGKSMGISVSPDPMPQEAIFVRSDHYRFVVQGVPAILLMTGYANGGKPKWEHFLSSVYHTPKDDLSQPIDWRAGAKYGELNYRIARTLADQDTRPLWYRGDYFGDTFAPGQARADR